MHRGVNPEVSRRVRRDRREEVRSAWEKTLGPFPRPQFVVVRAEIQKAYEELDRKRDNVFKVREQVKQDAAKLQSDVPEFVQYPNMVLKACDSETLPAPDPAMLHKIIDRDQKAIDDLMAAWIDKNTAAFPKDIKPGMLFKWYTTNTVYEVVKGPTQGTNKIPTRSGSSSKVSRATRWERPRLSTSRRSRPRTTGSS